MNKHQYVAIMAGGIGTRFWPLSRTGFPKQFLDILNTGQTMIQQTYNRFAKFIAPENIYVVTLKEYVELVKNQLPYLPPENIVAEPSRKNTATCIAYISFKLLNKDPKATLIVAPSDHLILDETNFIDICKKGLDFVNHLNSFVTIGVQPNSPNTGYGYIQHNGKEAVPGFFKVKTFIEKPNLEMAKTFVASGDFLWNAGIFIWKVEKIITAFEKHLPEVYELFAAEKEKFNTEEEATAIAEIYPQCTNISIDVAVMEKSDNVYVIPAAFGWSDLGTWNGAWDNMQKDYLQNAVTGKNVMIMEANHCIVHAPDNKLVLLQGLEDFIIVDTKDVLLICKKENEQDIKDYVAEVKRNKGDKFL
jgi:mannose-1-phosphate guanylyltransferase